MAAGSAAPPASTAATTCTAAPRYARKASILPERSDELRYFLETSWHGPDPTDEIGRIDTDIAVIGSGGAGLMCVLHALTADPTLDVAILSKGAIGRSGCTRMVQGGYNAVLDPADSLELHFSDTLEQAANSLPTTKISPGPSSVTRRR